MLICITAQGDNLDSEIDPRFGRCNYFIFYDTETKNTRFFQINGRKQAAEQDLKLFNLY